MSELIEEWKVWRDTRGSKNRKGSLWEVSNFGKIRKSGKEYIPRNMKRYLVFGPGWLVHRAVAELFLDNPENLPEIDHIDRNPQNNHYQNLRWCTRRENMQNIDWESLIKKISASLIGHKCTEETKHKISEVHKGKYSGKKNPMYGRHHTTETKQKMSESIKRHWEKRKKEAR